MSSSLYDGNMTANFRCGHPRTPENTTGEGRCRTCRNASNKVRAERRRRAEGRRERVVDPHWFPCGHPRTPENTRGARHCRECGRLRDAERDEARRQAQSKEKRVVDPNWYPCGHPRTPENASKDRLYVRCRECLTTAKREAYRADPTPYRVATQDRRLQNLEAAREYDRRRWPSRPHTELQRLGRRAREEDQRTPETMEYLAIVMQDPCVYCGGPANTRDHIVPISDGGPNRWDNYAPACRGCNSAKGNKSLLDFLLDRRLMLEYRERRLA
jgi:hypothetical protein